MSRIPRVKNRRLGRKLLKISRLHKLTWAEFNGIVIAFWEMSQMLLPWPTIRRALTSLVFTYSALGSQLLLPSGSGTVGSSVILPVQFAAQSDSTGGIQFDLVYDPTVVSLGVTLGDAARSAGKSVYYFDVAPNQRRFLMVGWNQLAIPDGTLINLFVNVKPNATKGVYPLSFADVSASTLSGNSSNATSINGSVTIQDSAGSGGALQGNGVLNGASLQPGPVAPGEFVTLIGSGIGPVVAVQPVGSPSSLSLAGTSVLFDGVPAPLLFASSNQINLIVPYSVADKTTTAMQLMSSSGVVAGFPLAVAASSPAILTLDASGGGPGAILNQDSSVNSTSNPAARGTVATLFATGAGKTNPPGVDAQVANDVLPVPVLPVSVEIGGVSAPILYAGAAPGLVAGILQVDFVIPADVSPANSVPIRLMVGSAASPSGVVLAVQ